MEIQLIRHKEISSKDIMRAVSLKSVAWPYPVDSQLKWISDNMTPDDMHVFLTEEGIDMGYMTLSPVKGILNGCSASFMGVGCVCSAKPGNGMGRQLVMSVNRYLFENDYKGLLFCKAGLIGFYSKCGWKVVEKEKVNIPIDTTSIFIMVYNCPSIKSIEYDGRMF